MRQHTIPCKYKHVFNRITNIIFNIDGFPNVMIDIPVQLTKYISFYRHKIRTTHYT